MISDEVHAPLVLPGAEHVPYLSLDGTADHAVALVAASKSFNTQGLKCAQVVSADAKTHERLVEVPLARNESWSSLGVVAALAAYRDGDAWLAALVQRLDRAARSAWWTCLPSTCRRPGCARSPPRTSRGSTCAPTATTTPPRSRSRAVSGRR